MSDPQFFNVLALRHFVTINIIHSNWLWQFFKWGKKKKITVRRAVDGPCATTIFGNVMQFPSRFFRHFIMGKTNGALPPHQDPYFVPQNGDFMIARLVIIIALQGRLLVTGFFASKKKNTFASSNVVLPQSATGWIRNTLLILIRMVYHIYG